MPSLVDDGNSHCEHSWRVGQDESHDFFAGVLVDVVEYLAAFLWTSGRRDVNDLVCGCDVIRELGDKAPLYELAG